MPAPYGPSAVKSFQRMPNKRLTPALLAAYYRTHYSAPHPCRPMRLGRQYVLPPDAVGTAFYWLTAWNPYSQVYPAQLNRHRNRRLVAWLNRQGCNPTSALAEGWPDAQGRRWPPEPGYWVQGLNRQQIKRLLRLHGQWAGLELSPRGRLRLLRARC